MTKIDDKTINFLKEIDKLKSIQRVLRLSHSNNRNENVAEHSWHVAMYVMLLKDQFSDDLNYSKMLEFALIHDLVEIYAGDTFIFDKEKLKDKKERESKAAKKLFDQLPDELRDRFFNLYGEYEEQESEESRIVYSLDKLQPTVQNLLSGGLDWKENNMTFEMLDNYQKPKMNNDKLLELYDKIMKEALNRDLFPK